MIRLMLFVACFTGVSAQAGLRCRPLFFKAKIGSQKQMVLNVFRGYPREAIEIAEELNYPIDWAYSQLGGVVSSKASESLQGNTSEVFLAESPSAERTVLKKYKVESDLHRDLFAYQKLQEISQSQSSFPVIRARVSSFHPRVLELEYREGVDFETFMRQNAGHPQLPDLIAQYNLYGAHLISALNSQRVSKFTEHSVEVPRPIIHADDSGLLIWVHPANVLVVKSKEKASGFDLVLIDPE